MTLHLTATTTEEKVLKEYLEQNASEVLADKINNGVPVEKDGKKLVSRKTLAGFMKYATDEARKQAAKGATCACLHSDIVFGWAIHYFEEDSILGTLYNEDGTEYTAPKPAASKKTATATATDTPTAPVPKPQPKVGQMSMFDLLDEPEVVSEETTETDKCAEDEVASDTYEEAPESPVEDEEPEVEQVPTVEVIELEKPLIEHINGLDVDTATGEIIEPEQAPDPYSDTELMYKIYLLLDQKVEIVK
ncbi:MAG: PcfK-like family protein [Oscillospiraceae bacterium]|nr:PcfK-like family protein [Clostridia bacterium]MBP3698636.1 PcfK-like family protein [Oscillospiraceae bacterium]